jgi:hypothetical protein
MSSMPLLYLLPLLIALGFAWLGVRYAMERRRERQLRERLRREPALPKMKSRSDSERSEMRAYEDATTVARTIGKKEPSRPVAVTPGADGTRSPSGV